MAKVTRVRLDGGLGNQLFQIAAGVHYTSKSNRVCQFYIPQVGRSKFSHQIDSSLYSRLEVTNSQTPKPIKGYDSISRVFNKGLKNSKILQRTLRILIDSNVGYSERLLERNDWREMRGYFQSYRFVEPHIDELKNTLVLSKRSSWLEGQLSNIKNVNLPISLHIRRGDFLKLKSIHGVLGRSYYESAITNFQRDHKNPTFLVFSDDLELAHKLLSDIEGEFIFLNPPSNSPSGESMFLMWKCKGHVIANSTFSWWGAYLSDSHNKVIAPNQWMRNGMEVKDLIPPSWQLIDAAWEEN